MRQIRKVYKGTGKDYLKRILDTLHKLGFVKNDKASKQLKWGDSYFLTKGLFNAVVNYNNINNQVEVFLNADEDVGL